MPHSPENSQRIVEEISKGPDAPAADWTAIARQSNQLAEIVEQVATVLRMPHGSKVEDVVEVARAAYEEPRMALNLDQATPSLEVGEEIRKLIAREMGLTEEFRRLAGALSLADDSAPSDVVTHVTLLQDEAEDLREQVRAANARVEALKDEVETHKRSYTALDSEAREVREVLGLSPRDASATEVLDRLRALNDSRAALRGLGVSVGLGESASATRIAARVLQLVTFETEVRELLNLDETAAEEEIVARIRDVCADSQVLAFVRRHLRMDNSPEDIEQRVAVLQAEADSVREHLFLPREVEGWQVTKSIRELREGILKAVQYAKPAPIVIDPEAFTPELQERLVQALEQKPTFLTEPVPMVDHSPQPGMTVQVIRESSGPEGFTLYDVRNRIVLERKISREDVMARLRKLVHVNEWPRVASHLTKVFDEEQENVHIGSIVRDDLQVADFPQDDTTRALALLELTSPVSPQVSEPYARRWHSLMFDPTRKRFTRTSGGAPRYEVFWEGDRIRIRKSGATPATGALVTSVRNVPGYLAGGVEGDEPFCVAVEDGLARELLKGSPDSDGAHYRTLYVDAPRRIIGASVLNLTPHESAKGTTASVTRDDNTGMYVVTRLSDQRRWQVRSLYTVRDVLFGGQLGRWFAVAVQEDVVAALQTEQGKSDHE